MPPFLFGMMVSRQGLEPRLAPYESAVTNQLHHRDIQGWAFDLRFSADRSARAVSSPQAMQPCLLFLDGVQAEFLSIWVQRQDSNLRFRPYEGREIGHFSTLRY